MSFCLTLRCLSIRHQAGQSVSKEHHVRHQQALEQPVPKELDRHIAFVEPNQPEVGNHEEDRRYDEVRNLKSMKKKDYIHAVI